MKLWVNDEREAPDCWVWAKTSADALISVANARRGLWCAGSPNATAGQSVCTSIPPIPLGDSGSKE